MDSDIKTQNQQPTNHENNQTFLNPIVIIASYIYIYIYNEISGVRCTCMQRMCLIITFFQE